jgi:hypothetical protein
MQLKVDYIFAMLQRQQLARRIAQGPQALALLLVGSALANAFVSSSQSGRGEASKALHRSGGHNQ